MTEKSVSLEEKISWALNTCIEKMADHLSRTFDSKEKESIRLFQRFCSALNARRQWLKSLGQKDGIPVEKFQKAKRMWTQNYAQSVSTPTWTETQLSTLKSNGLLQPQDLNNGFVMKR